jgi:predicted nucleic acid-binding protein
MKGYLVDTNIPSELMKPRPEPGVADFVRRAGKEQVYLSVLSLGEIVKGIAALPQGKRRRNLEAWLDAEIRPWFADRLLPVSAAIAERWGRLSARARAQGISLPVVDGLIAATALENELTLVTRNSKDFAGCGLDLANPWQ